jgi:tRNA(Leu) C34 or U34 (ribose-2'-O)-methylase TrmL
MILSSKTVIMRRGFTAVNTSRNETDMTSVILIDPKYPHNVGASLRACAAFGADHLYVTGHRAQWEITGKGQRLPREERMRVYRDKVNLIRNDRPFDLCPGLTPVAVEVDPTAEPLANFQHPDNALYVFGPEDGSIPKATRRFCQRFVIIPSDHCLNLASAVACTLMHRRIQRQLLELEEIRPAYETMQEERG